MLRRKPPVINGKIPDERHDLEDDSELLSLGLDPTAKLKLSDEYDHYPNCDWAILEHKSRSLKDSVKQLGETAERLRKIQKDVDFAIIVAMKINRAEKHIFRKLGNVLYNKLTKTPVQISTGVNRIKVNIYYVQEVEKQHRQYLRSLMRWVSK